jgi:hypothetical protein
LPFLIIDVRALQHVIRPFFQENLQAVYRKGRIAGQGCFGYVHSQRRASTARNDKNSHSISGSPLLLDHFLKLLHCAVSQRYHNRTLSLIKK